MIFAKDTKSEKLTDNAVTKPLNTHLHTVHTNCRGNHRNTTHHIRDKNKNGTIPLGKYSARNLLNMTVLPTSYFGFIRR